ncbi:MAG: hypothetical protein ACKVOW_17500 [Chitinophagaceae bacterium]
MQLVEVVNAKLARAFIKVNVEINKTNPAYIRPLDKDINEVFDSKKNKTFQFGEATRWILRNDDGELIGRIAVFTNNKYKNKGDDVAVGGIGFFDCINNVPAAEMLFDVAKHWLIQRGVEAMDGPINFGERDRWWGLLVEGFQSPLYCMNYNPPYYKYFFENYGFRCFYNQYCHEVDPRKEFSEKIKKHHSIVAGNPSFKAISLEGKDPGTFAEDFSIVYNKAWAGHEGEKEITKEQALQLFNKMRPVIDKKLLWFVYDRNNPIAIFFNLPDLNQWFKELDGSLSIWNQLKFLWIKRIHPPTKITGLVFGIVPEFQQKGIDAFLIVEAGKVFKTLSYTRFEAQWIGDFNPKMMKLAESFGETFLTRKLITYRYLFDRTKDFRRHPIL